MERIVRRLASKIAVSLGFDAEKEAVVAYGLIAIVQISVTVLLVLLFGLALGVVWEALTVCFSVSLYRKYSGGAHANDANFCTVVTVVYCSLAALLAGRLAAAVRPVPMFIAILLVYAFVMAVTYRYAPVDSPNKPVKSERKIKRMRKASFIVIAAYFILQMFLFIFKTPAQNYRSLGISLLLGVSWQAFTLTPLGTILLHKLNDLPKYLRKEVSK